DRELPRTRREPPLLRHVEPARLRAGCAEGPAALDGRPGPRDPRTPRGCVRADAPARRSLPGRSVYVTTTAGSLYSFNRLTGRLRWHRRDGTEAFYAGPTVATGGVYAGTHERTG